MLTNENYLILIINNLALKEELKRNGYQVIYFDEVDEAKKHYQLHKLEIDLIVENENVMIDYGEKFTTLNLNENQFDLIKNMINNDLKTHYFNHDLALSMLDHNERIYHNLINRFVNNYNNLEEQIINLLKEEDYLSIRELVHKVKGITLNLGSQKFYDICKDVEDKIVNNTIKKEDILLFIRFHNRILEYGKEQENHV